MNFTFEWYDDEKTVMAYRAQGNWNWRDYHAAARASIFSMHRHPHTVDVLVDLRGSTRETLPSGIAAHVRTFGKILTPALSGNAVVLGMPDDAVQQLTGSADDPTLPTRDGEVIFAPDENAARAIFARWRADRA